MQSGGSAPVAGGSGSPGRCAALVESAVHHFIIRTDFHAAFEACESGLEIVAKAEEQETNCPRHGELKASLCIIGIQALAELNQWRDVLAWVSRHYGETERIPVKIMQMCILLYTKVEEQAEVLEAARSWLRRPANTGLQGYSSVAELYVLHVLLPLGRTSEAEELLRDDVGQLAFTEDQRQTALSILQDHEAKVIHRSHPPVPTEEKKTIEGSVARRLNAVLRLLYRGLSLAGATSWSRFVHRTAALLFLLYLLLVRMDPAFPSAYAWILRLYGLWRQMWDAMFGPYYRASS